MLPPGRTTGTAWHAGAALFQLLRLSNDYRTFGVIAVELLPVHNFVDDRYLVEKGLRNYWGYSPISFFAPNPRYLSKQDLGEFKTMVSRLHDAGIEVILDVVYNHTAEGNELGPTLSFRGIDNKSYYRLDATNERHYIDYTGCGNSLNLDHPFVLKMVTDSLRYWVREMHVDGFRFDLATTLARREGEFSQNSTFLASISQDPVLSRVKLIAEPWDLGYGGYRLGGFPVGWSEWNDRFRDGVRRFWRGTDGQISDMATRLTGSSDVFDRAGRRPRASLNFITAHDGFTLNDLVSYDHKHNDANQEGGRDGHDENISWNCGTEGPTDSVEIVALREKQKAQLFRDAAALTRPAEMLLAGDELGHTQHGNNNAYCQGNEISWLRLGAAPRGRVANDRVRARTHCPAAQTSGLPAVRVSSAARRCPAGRSRTSPACSRRARDEWRRLARRRPPLFRRAALRRNRRPLHQPPRFPRSR